MLVSDIRMVVILHSGQTISVLAVFTRTIVPYVLSRVMAMMMMMMMMTMMLIIALLRMMQRMQSRSANLKSDTLFYWLKRRSGRKMARGVVMVMMLTPAIP